MQPRFVKHVPLSVCQGKEGKNGFELEAQFGNVGQQTQAQFLPWE
jgi:hypothetical protein